MNREELRDAMVLLLSDVRDDAYGMYTFDAPAVADALLTGPVGDLLAENERLRGKVERRTAKVAEHEAAEAAAVEAMTLVQIERERIAAAIEGLEKPSGPIDRIAVWLLAMSEAARIARSGGAS